MTLPDRFRLVRDGIAVAAESVDRDPGEVTLVAISKTRNVDEIRALYDLGVRDFGESRLQEALPKIESLPNDIRWHFIGTLQSNKAKRVAEKFALIHSLDSEGALREIAKVGGDVLLEIDLAGEGQKSGIPPGSIDAMGKSVLHYGNVRLRGLVTVGPADVPIARTREIFRELRVLNDRLGLPFLSMGMSADYAEAVMDGATHVRVGSLLFGLRPQ